MRGVQGWRVVWVFVLLMVAVVGSGCSERASTAPKSSARAADSTTAERTPPVDPRQVVVIGDEYATGTELGGLGPTNWTNDLQRRLGAAGADAYVRNFARAGTGYTPTSPNATTFGDDVARGVNADTDLVIFFGGGNDVGSLDSLRAAVLGALESARAIAPEAKLMVVGPLWSREGSPDEGVQAASNTIRDAAGEAGVEFIDPIAEDWFGGRSDLIGDDGVHPNDAAQSAIAERLTDRVVAALNTAPARPS